MISARRMMQRKATPRPIPACRNCSAEHFNERHRLKMPQYSKEDEALFYPAVAIGIMPVREEFKDKPPVYWPMCENHATLGLIAGFNPKWFDTPEGKDRLRAFNSTAA